MVATFKTAAPILRRNETESFRLPLYGPARLERGGDIVKLRRKSLAILYYLAIEGAARRSVLADLLWEQLDSAQNLRVELHSLKKALGRYGAPAFPDNQDPLKLPESIQVDDRPGNGDILEGLEDLSPQFQIWLEQHRAKSAYPRSVQFVHRKLVLELARQITYPYLLILSGEPDGGQQAFADSLASALGLPLRRDPFGSEPAVRYLSRVGRADDGVVEGILSDRRSVWVLERPAFEEDPDFLLRLRSSYPADRITYIELPPLSWLELNDQLPTPLSFSDAAAMYTFTGGHPGFLRELLALRQSGDRRERSQLPQRIRAAYQLEARGLTTDARFALERASVHPGPLSDGLLAALEVEPHLVELARLGWLAFDGGWRFSGNVPRAVIYHSLTDGHARLYHQIAARQLARDGAHVAAAYHRSRTEGTIDWESVALHSEGWARRVADERRGHALPSDAPLAAVPLSDEYPLLESELFGSDVRVQAGSLTIVRQPLQVGRSGAEWPLSPGGGVLHLKGRAYAKNVLDVGLNGDAVPLRVEFLGRERQSVVFAAVAGPQTLEDGTLVLPLSEEIDCHLQFRDALLVRLWSSAEATVLELSVTAYRTGPSGSQHRARAFCLDRLAPGREPAPTTTLA